MDKKKHKKLDYLEEIKAIENLIIYYVEQNEVNAKFIPKIKNKREDKRIRKRS